MSSRDSWLQAGDVLGKIAGSVSFIYIQNGYIDITNNKLVVVVAVLCGYVGAEAGSAFTGLVYDTVQGLVGVEIDSQIDGA